MSSSKSTKSKPSKPSKASQDQNNPNTENNHVVVDEDIPYTRGRGRIISEFLLSDIKIE